MTPEELIAIKNSPVTAALEKDRNVKLQFLTDVRDWADYEDNGYVNAYAVAAGHIRVKPEPPTYYGALIDNKVITYLTKEGRDACCDRNNYKPIDLIEKPQ